MDSFILSCRNYTDYPENLLDSAFHVYELLSYQEKLRKGERTLCYRQKDADAADDWGIHCWEKNDSGAAFTSAIIDSLDRWQKHIEDVNGAFKQNVITRYMFLHAKNARERLNTTMSMLQSILSHQQVSPAVIDQLLSYGRRKTEQEFSACSFRQEVNTSLRSPGTILPSLGRSGRRLQLCYTLRTIEDPDCWRMRQTSIYHSFDVVSGQAFWLVIKANEVIRERLQQVTDQPTRNTSYMSSMPANLLATSLISHSVVCSWANENWRPYIGELEVQVHALTKPAVAFDVRSSPRMPQTRSSTFGNENTASAQQPALSRRSTFQKLQRASTILLQPFSRRTTAGQDTNADSQVIDLHFLNGESNPEADINARQEEEQHFSISDMQTIQAVEEKVNAAQLVLKTNLDTLSQLRDFYSTMDRFEGWPHDLKTECQEPITQFAVHVSNIEFDLRMQHARLETLTRLLADRKALFYAIIEHRNVQANKDLANRAQESQEHMERLTKHMSSLAEKTQQETVSMRIITLVTLFFLPATFVCTLFSTDIIQFEAIDGGSFKELFSIQALRVFFAITIPLMVVTFTAWYILAWWIKNRQKVRKWTSDKSIRNMA